MDSHFRVGNGPLAWEEKALLLLKLTHDSYQKKKPKQILILVKIIENRKQAHAKLF